MLDSSRLIFKSLHPNIEKIFANNTSIQQNLCKLKQGISMQKLLNSMKSLLNQVQMLKLVLGQDIQIVKLWLGFCTIIGQLESEMIPFTVFCRNMYYVCMCEAHIIRIQSLILYQHHDVISTLSHQQKLAIFLQLCSSLISHWPCEEFQNF